VEGIDNPQIAAGGKKVNYDNIDMNSMPGRKTADENGISVNGKPTTLEEMAAAAERNEERKSISEGVEISSNAKGLAAALTNPTELARRKGNLDRSYTVTFEGKTYPDAETAYQELKSAATMDDGPNNTYNLMVRIIKAKLEQHPELITQISEQGGSDWILSSTHQPSSKNTVWETGGKNWFIKALNEAYTSIEDVEETYVESANPKNESPAAPVEGRSILDLIDDDDEVSPLFDFWENTIEGNKDAIAKLKANGIQGENGANPAIEDFYKARNDGMYPSDEDFLDYIKSCIL
jgi:hypothetical protein